jgi:hypothetical protein
VSGERLSYRFGPLERRGLLGPMRASQAVTIGVAAVVAVLALDRLPTAAGAMVGLIVLATATGAATVPLGRATVAEWSPIAAAFALTRLSGRTRFRSPLPSRGFRTSQAPRPELPPALTGVELLDLPYRDRTIGALAEARGRRLTAVLACQVASFELLDQPAQERRLAHWGVLLTASATAPIRRLQWIERAAPAQGDELARWLHEQREPSLPPRGAPLMESYLELIGASAPVMHDHEILLAVQIDSARVRGGPEAAREALVEQALRLARGLEEAEIRVLGALSAGQLARALRTAFDPYVRSELAALEAVEPGRDGLEAIHAAPLGTEERWDQYRADGACHATYWIGGWPRVDVSPMFMNALLAPSGTVRTVAVTFEPVAPERSAREAEAAVTRDRADRELRQRFGQSETARQRSSRESAARRESELAAGHGEVRFAGFVTVTGRDEQELGHACAEVLRIAARARIELYRMYGQQSEAFTFTLPLARGLR